MREGGVEVRIQWVQGKVLQMWTKGWWAEWNIASAEGIKKGKTF